MAKVVSLGIHIVDVLGRPVAQVPPGQGLALLDQIRMTVAGTAAGTSVDMAKLGLEVSAVGAVGADEIGDFLVATMGRYGIDTRGLVRKTNAQTSATMLPIRPNGERPALHVIGANGEFMEADVDLGIVAAARFLHVGGTPLMPKFDGAPASRVLRYAKDQGLTTTFDLLGLPRPNLAEVVESCLPHVDYFMPNQEEAFMIRPSPNLEDVCRHFLACGAKRVVVRRGGDGSVIAWEENGVLRTLTTPAFVVDVVDSTGCGDAYNAGFIKGLSLGWDLERSAQLGCACGGLCIGGLGSDAGIVDLAQTLEFMARTPVR